MASKDILFPCLLRRGSPALALYGAVVGTILNLINQGDAIVAMAGVDWLKISLTYLVPYAVCTFGAVSTKATAD